MATGVDPEYSVYVGNLNPSTTLSDMEDLIFELFLQAGPLDKVFIPYDKDTGKHKGYGFVEFLHRESIQYSINLMNGICLLDRYLNVRTVNQRQQNVPTLSGKNSPSSVSTPMTPGAAKAIEDNPFLSTAKPLTKIAIPPPPEVATTATVSAGTSQTPSTPPGPAQLMQCTTPPVQPPTPLFPTSTIAQMPSNPSPLLHVQQAQHPKLLPLNPFLEPGYSPAPPPNPFLQDLQLRCLLPLPPPPLQLTPPLAPPLLFPPPPLLQTLPLAPPPIPLFPTPLDNNGGSFQSNVSSASQPVPLFPDLSPSPSQPDYTCSPTTGQSDDSTTSSVPNSSLGLTFETAHLAMSFHTPPPTPNNEANVQLSNCQPSGNHVMLQSNLAGDIDSEMDFEPENRDSGSLLRYSGDHERLHKGRLHANDHPAWLRGETKAKLSQYHLDTLNLALHGLKKSMNSRQSL